MPRRILQGGLLVSPVGCGIVDGGTLVIEDGHIVEVSTRRYAGPEVEHCDDRIVMPGLCNAHLHSEFLLFKGMLEERRLGQWEDDRFYDMLWDRVERPIDEPLLTLVYRLSYLEQLRNGVTFVGEFNCIDQSARLSERIQEEVGIRGTASAKLDELRPVKSLDVYSLHHELGLTQGELEAASERMLLEDTSRFTLHAAETSERMAAVRERFGTSTIRLLERFGLLTPRMLLSHAVHVDEEEVQLMARRGVAVVASPTGEMKLCDGVSPILSYLRAGVRVCLGTDCATCNNDADLFLEMKALGLLHKLTHGAHELPAETLLRLGSVEGYRAFGITDLGMLAPGARADIILIDRHATSLVPLIHNRVRSNVYANLVYSCTGREVRDVMVGGEWRIRSRQHVSLDVRETVQALQEASVRLWQEVAGE